MDTPSRGGVGFTWWSEPGFLRRVLILVGIVAFALLLWQLRHVLLLGFAAVLVAVIVLAAADPFKRHFGLSHLWAVTAACVAILLVVVLAGLLIGGQVQAQVQELTRQLPAALRQVEQGLGIDVPIIGQQQAAGAVAAGQGGDGLSTTAILSRVASFGMTVLDALAAFILAIVGGVFLAAAPDLYKRGFVKLFPVNQHARVEDLLETTGQALRQWLIAELIAMAIIAVLVSLGTWLIGLPAPLALGLFAGLTEFIPIVGPFIGAVPAVLLALTQGGGSVVWTILLFLAIQQLESNVITPLVQERMVEIPPALLLLSVAAFGALFGIAGVILAAPLTVAAFVAVKKLYVRQTLGEATEVPGEKH